jgi:hypothetical protein
MEFIIAHKAEILGVLWGLSEALSFIPSVKANGVFQMIFEALKKAKGE